MKQREVRNLLADSFRLEQEYHEFAIECLKRIYGNHANIAILLFEEGVEMFDWNGCLQGLCAIDRRIDSIPKDPKQTEKE